MGKTFHFGRDLLQSIGSSGVGLFLTLITTPIMTRLFAPDAYGVNAVVLNVATLVASLGLLGLPVALARQKKVSEQARLFNASVQMAVIIFGLSTVLVVVAFFNPAALPDGMSMLVALIFPFLVLVHSAQRIVDSLVTAKGLFPAQAAARIGNAVTSRALPIFLGWLVYPGTASMLTGDGAGKITHVIVTVRLGNLRSDWRGFRWKPASYFLRNTLREYRDFAFQSNVATALPLLSALAVQVVLGARLGTEAIGYYALAQSIITLPVTVIALASAPVVFHRLVLIADETPDKLPGLAMKVMLSYLVVGAVCMSPIVFFGPIIFEVAFGDAWRSAGVAASILAIPQLLAFSLTGTLALFRVTHKINAWFGFELAGTTAIVGGLVLLPPSSNLITAMIFLASLKFVYNVLMLAGCMWASRQLTDFHR
ncbi:oligosaccharide flippase family protein [Marinobacter adhaerens]|nr:oligosaccharide flippase family protein [Marinobacter adhaerens]MBW4980239.1 oligosaccharide flippase family protein [Marinobacter adhaerens]